MATPGYEEYVNMWLGLNVPEWWWLIHYVTPVDAVLFLGEVHTAHQQITGAAACGTGCYLP